MTLAVSMKLGPYEILGPLGAGGMGEVYRAKDTRLAREVAVKVLAKTLSEDPASLARFEREARAVAALSHPNILAIFDLGRERDTNYAVMELLEGETLEQRLVQGPLPVSKAVDVAGQIAQGLAAAHEKGIVHRDLKPANIFLTKGGPVKVLDFGLARMAEGAAALEDMTSRTLTAKPVTGPGVMLGTVGYMAPEQVQGKAADGRADLFALGAVMYEMVAGRRAFEGAFAVETLNAILKADPPELSGDTPASIPPALERVIRHCLEKNPEERFQSARDLAFALRSVDSASGGAAATVGRARRRLPRVAWWAAAVMAAAGLFVAGRLIVPAPQASTPTYRQLTFERGAIHHARFAPDGETIVYGAAWEGGPIKAYLMRASGVESQPLALPASDVLSVSSKGDLLLSLGASLSGWITKGMLARVDLLGTTPHSILDGVTEADWLPDGEQMVVAHRVGGRDRLEFPKEHIVYETPGYISHVRVSPHGDRVAFLDHPIYGDDRGWVSTADREGNVRRLTGEWKGLEGLAWTPDGREIWFTGVSSLRGYYFALYAVSPSATPRTPIRLVWSIPSDIWILDIQRSGRVLCHVGFLQGIVFARSSPGNPERETGSLRFSRARGISSDGKQVLLTNYDQRSGDEYQVFLRPTDGGSAMRLGPGEATDLSADGRWVLSAVPGENPHLTLLPTGPGEARTIPAEGPTTVDARFLPDSRQAIVISATSDMKRRAFRVTLDGTSPAEPLPKLDEALARLPALAIGDFHVSPDGRRVALCHEGQAFVAPVEEGEIAAIPGFGAGDRLVRWAGNENEVLVVSWSGNTGRVDKLDVQTGRRELLREIELSDPAGLTDAPRVCMSPDGGAYVYSAIRDLNILVVVEGLK